MSIKTTIKNAINILVQMSKEEKVYPVPQPVNMKKILEGKTAFITGGTSGIGYEIAKVFIDHGAKVAICGTNETKLNKAIVGLGTGNVVGYILDVSDVVAVNRQVTDIVNKLGHIDILVNSAGVVGGTSFNKVTEEEYDRIMDINVKGTFFVSQVVSDHMISNGIKGHILNISSAASIRPAWMPYQMSKWTIKGFTMGLADTLLPYGIIVNAIAPGPVATPMLNKNENDSIWKDEQPSHRYATASEIANMAVMMASDFCNLVVGDTLYMTGGSGVIDLRK